MKICGHSAKWYQIPYKALRYIFNKTVFLIEDIMAIKRLQKTKENKHPTDIIYVCFVSQMLEVWDKQAPLFEAMKLDKRFCPNILCVPEYDFTKKKLTDNNSVYSYFSLKYESDCLFKYEEDQMLDFKMYNYVFYDRPYNHYLPKKIRSNIVSKYSRICEINYCTSDWNRPGGFPYDDFAKDVSIWFASNDSEYNNYCNSRMIKTKLRRAENVGYPAFEYYYKIKDYNTLKSDSITILWTPRWSYDEGVGGSHFFEYIDSFINFAMRNKNVNLIIRPHPLMFDNFVFTGKMSVEDVVDLKRKCLNVGIIFDDNKMIKETFENCDILVSDYSSVLSLFMLTGKPIVYCPTNVPINSMFEELSHVFYVAYDFDDINNYCNNLINGIDEKQEERNKMCRELLSPIEGVVDCILNILVSNN